MKISYDRETDSLTITLRHDRIRESDEITPDIIADLAEDGSILRFEIMQASKLVEEPDRVTFEIAEPVPATRPAG
jgi:uncharacterized protein YuzE